MIITYDQFKAITIDSSQRLLFEKEFGTQVEIPVGEGRIGFVFNLVEKKFDWNCWHALIPTEKQAAIKKKLREIKKTFYQQTTSADKEHYASIEAAYKIYYDSPKREEYGPVEKIAWEKYQEEKTEINNKKVNLIAPFEHAMQIQCFLAIIEAL